MSRLDLTPVDRGIRDRIVRHGPLPYADVVEAALYDPEAGFYTAGGRAGRGGDFITSPEVGPLFGAVVARALDGWWREAGEPGVFVVVEAGAGPGALARAVLAAAPACAPALRYVLVERSAAQRAGHASRLDLEDPASAFAGVAEPTDEDEPTVEPPAGPLVVSLPELPRLPAPCVVLANELLDNLPFGLVERTVDGWAEVRVGLGLTHDAPLQEVLVPADRVPGVDARVGGGVPAQAAEGGAPVRAVRPGQAMAGDVPVGARLPVHDVAREWIRDARHLAGPGGRVVAFDYGAPAADLARRPWTEWVRTYRGHERGGHPLEALGTQDVTVEVCTDGLGATPSADRSQAEWLRAHGIDELVDEGRRTWQERAHLGDLAAIRARSRVTEAEALLDPVGLGAFRVLEWPGA